jgi:hypothetical protein
MSADIDRSFVRVCKLGEEPSWVDEYTGHSIDERLAMLSDLRGRVVRGNSPWIEFIDELNQRGVRYLVAGKVAVAAHGFVEANDTLDVWLAPEATDVDSTRGEKPHLIALHSRLPAVDFDEAWSARAIGRFEGRDVPLISLAHLLTYKRASGVSRDLAHGEEFDRSEKFRR